MEHGRPPCWDVSGECTGLLQLGPAGNPCYFDLRDRLDVWKAPSPAGGHRHADRNHCGFAGAAARGSRAQWLRRGDRGLYRVVVAARQPGSVFVYVDAYANMTYMLV